METSVQLKSDTVKYESTKKTSKKQTKKQTRTCLISR